MGAGLRNFSAPAPVVKQNYIHQYKHTLMIIVLEAGAMSKCHFLLSAHPMKMWGNFSENHTTITNMYMLDYIVCKWEKKKKPNLKPNKKNKKLGMAMTRVRQIMNGELWKQCPIASRTNEVTKI